MEWSLLRLRLLRSSIFPACRRSRQLQGLDAGAAIPEGLERSLLTGNGCLGIGRHSHCCRNYGTGVLDCTSIGSHQDFGWRKLNRQETGKQRQGGRKRQWERGCFRREGRTYIQWGTKSGTERGTERGTESGTERGTESGTKSGGMSGTKSWTGWIIPLDLQFIKSQRPTVYSELLGPRRGGWNFRMYISKKKVDLIIYSFFFTCVFYRFHFLSFLSSPLFLFYLLTSLNGRSCKKK